MEKWDLYGPDRQKLNKTVCRGDNLNDNEYHLVTNAWLVNNEGKFLISQRVATKPHPNMWECTGGSCLQGEDSLNGAIREVKEELGIDVDKSSAKFVGSALRYFKNCQDILEVWLFNCNADIADITIQQEEVQNVMWATKEQIYALLKEDKFLIKPYVLEVINSVINI